MASEIVNCPYCGNDVSHEVIEVHGFKIIACAKHPPGRPPMFHVSHGQLKAAQMENKKAGFMQGYSKPIEEPK